MGASIAKIMIGGLVVIALYNIVSSPNSQGILGTGLTGSATVIKSLEGK